MMFRHQNLNKTLEWNENQHLCELIVESPQFLRRLLRDFSVEDEARQISFADADKYLDFGKEIDVVFNPLKLDFNNRRVTTTLLKNLVKTSLSENYYLESNNLKTQIIKYLNRLIDEENYSFEMETEDFGFDDLAKATGLHIVGDEDDFIELLTDYMSMMSELAGIKIFIFVNLRTIIREEELERLQHNLNNHQIDVLLIESRDYGRIDAAPRIIVDSDQCEL